MSTKVNATRIVQVPELPVKLACSQNGLLDIFKDKVVRLTTALGTSLLL